MNHLTKHYLRRIKYFPLFRREIFRRRMELIRNHSIDLILDVGANAGQYTSIMRALGFKGKVVSFEPLEDAFKQLQILANTDRNWEVRQLALGDTECESEINVSANLQSSSILGMMPKHVETAPQSKYMKKETIQVKTLDQVFEKITSDNNNVLLKIDTQGYEKNVIMGADKALENIRGVQMEMSLVPLYENEALFDELILLLRKKGFELMAIEPGLDDPNTGQLLQIEGLFFKTN